MRLTGEYVILAQRVLHDSMTDMMSAIGLVEVVLASQFPSQVYGFAVVARFRADEPPATDTPVEFRIVRVSASDGERPVDHLALDWRAGTSFGRVATNFQTLQLFRAERLLFRVDWRLENGDWVEGPATSVDVIDLPDEDETEEET